MQAYVFKLNVYCRLGCSMITVLTSIRSNDNFSLVLVQELSANFLHYFYVFLCKNIAKDKCDVYNIMLKIDLFCLKLSNKLAIIFETREKICC